MKYEAANCWTYIKKWQLEWIQSLDHINFPILLPLVWIQYLPPGVGGAVVTAEHCPGLLLAKRPMGKRCQILRPPYFLGSIKTQCFETWGWNLASWGKNNGSKAMNSHILLGYFMVITSILNIHLPAAGRLATKVASTSANERSSRSHAVARRWAAWISYTVKIGWGKLWGKLGIWNLMISKVLWQ